MCKEMCNFTKFNALDKKKIMKKQPRKPGRKPKPESSKLSERIPFNCTPSQRQAYDKACGDLDRAEWIRRILDAYIQGSE